MSLIATPLNWYRMNRCKEAREWQHLDIVTMANASDSPAKASSTSRGFDQYAVLKLILINVVFFALRIIPTSPSQMRDWISL